VISVLTPNRIKKMKISSISDEELVISAEKHSLFYLRVLYPVRPWPKSGAVNYVVNVRALKSTIMEDLD